MTKNIRDLAWPEADSYTLMTFYRVRDEEGCLQKTGDLSTWVGGIGPNGGTCDKGKRIGRRRNIVTYNHNDIITAKVSTAILPTAPNTKLHLPCSSR